jgi:REP element-mobilizing transposase RayT
MKKMVMRLEIEERKNVATTATAVDLADEFHIACRSQGWELVSWEVMENHTTDN